MELTNKAILSYILSLVFFCVPQVQARSYHSYDAASPPFITVAELPSQARDTLRLIYQGGPFPYPRDGIVFGNRERQLPAQSRGYYREYTVKTPGVHSRGARRIVCGVVPARGRPMGSPLLRSDPFALPECYYSDDHYQSFKRIKE